MKEDKTGRVIVAIQLPKVSIMQDTVEVSLRIRIRSLYCIFKQTWVSNENIVERFH